MYITSSATKQIVTYIRKDNGDVISGNFVIANRNFTGHPYGNVAFNAAGNMFIASPEENIILMVSALLCQPIHI